MLVLHIRMIVTANSSASDRSYKLGTLLRYCVENYRQHMCTYASSCFPLAPRIASEFVAPKTINPQSVYTLGVYRFIVLIIYRLEL